MRHPPIEFVIGIAERIEPSRNVFVRRATLETFRFEAMSELYEANKIERHKKSKTVRALKDVSILQPCNRSTVPLVLM